MGLADIDAMTAAADAATVAFGRMILIVSAMPSVTIPTPPEPSTRRTGVTAPPLIVTAEDSRRTSGKTDNGGLTPEERRLRARTDDAEDDVDQEAKNILSQFGFLRAKATATFADASDALGDAADDARDSFYDTADAAADAFGSAVGEATNDLAVAASGIGAMLDQLRGFVGDGTFASEAFDQDGNKTGGAITNQYANELLDTFIRVRQYIDAARIDPLKNNAANRAEIGLERLEIFFDRTFSRFGRLEDLAREQMNRTRRAGMRPPTKKKKKKAAASSVASATTGRWWP